MYRQLPWGRVPGYAPISADSNDPETQYTGMVGRLLRDTPVPEFSLLKEFKVFVKDFIEKYVLSEKVEPMTLEEYLAANKSYTESRKQELRDAFEALKGGRPTPKQIRRIESFIKTESYLEWKLARWINSRSDAFKAYAACYLKPIENLVFKMKWFIKHVPVPERPALIMGLVQAGLRYFSTDFTAFECHFKRYLMHACEVQLYRACLRWCTEGDFIIDALSGSATGDLKTNNHLRTRLGTACKLQARRMSGDLVTSLGNGFTNLMLALFCAYKTCGSWENHINGFVEGDDGIFACDFEMTSEFYKRMGFTIKIVEVDSPNRASFCGLVFAETAIIRDPRSFLMSFGWTSSFINAGEDIMMELLKAKALSCMYECGACPIVAMMAYCALKKCANHQARFILDGYHDARYAAAAEQTVLSRPEPTPATRRLFAELYDVPEDLQFRIEALIEADDLDAVASLLPAPEASARYEELYRVLGT